MSNLNVVSATGRKWDVRIVNTGDTYGRNNCLVSDKPPMVEFYDLTNSPEGYFVSSYFVSTLVDDRDPRCGLSLDGSNDDYAIDNVTMNEIVKFLSGANYD